MFSTFLECTQMYRVFYHSHGNTRLRLLHLLYDIDFTAPGKTMKHASMFYTLINIGF